VAMVCFAHAASAVPWAPATFPNPYSDIAQCGRAGLPSRICDPDSVLSPESANVVEGIIKSIEAAKLPYAPSPCPAAGEEGYQVSPPRKLHDQHSAQEHDCTVGECSSHVSAMRVAMDPPAPHCSVELSMKFWSGTMAGSLGLPIVYGICSL